MSTLKRCPFCDGVAKEQVGLYAFTDVIIVCDECGAEGPLCDHVDGLEASRAAAVKHWNTRAPHKAEPAAPFALETAAVMTRLGDVLDCPVVLRVPGTGGSTPTRIIVEHEGKALVARLASDGWHFESIEPLSLLGREDLVLPVFNVVRAIALEDARAAMRTAIDASAAGMARQCADAADAALVALKG